MVFFVNLLSLLLEFDFVSYMLLIINIKKVMHLLFCMSSNLAIILFHVNVRPYIARMKLQKLTDLG